MTPERLEEIRRLAAESSVFLGTGLAPIRELLAEVDRLRGALEEAGEYVTRWKLEWLPHHAYRDENVAAEADRKRVQGIIRAALSPSPEPRAAIGGGDCGVCYLNPCCCAPPPPREAESTQSEPGRECQHCGGEGYRTHQDTFGIRERRPCPHCQPRAPDPAPEPTPVTKESKERAERLEDEYLEQENRRKFPPAEPRKEPERWIWDEIESAISLSWRDEDWKVGLGTVLANVRRALEGT